MFVQVDTLWRDDSRFPGLASDTTPTAHGSWSAGRSSRSVVTSDSNVHHLQRPSVDQISRSFAASSSVETKAAVTATPDVQDASSILQQVSVRKLCNHLQSESERRHALSMEELVHLIKSHTIALTDSHAHTIIDALHTSGIILRFRDQVYLRPAEIAGMVIGALPDTAAEAQAKIREIEDRLKPMQQQFNKIERKARFRSNLVAYGGLGLLTAQFTLFARLTYWELSWDVMEPLSYFTGQATVIACYLYFLATRRDFTYSDHFKNVVEQKRLKIMGQSKFDYDQYEKLCRDLERWKAYTRSLPR